MRVLRVWATPLSLSPESVLTRGRDDCLMSLLSRQSSQGFTLFRTSSLIRWMCPRPKALTSHPSSKYRRIW